MFEEIRLKVIENDKECFVGFDDHFIRRVSNQGNDVSCYESLDILSGEFVIEDFDQLESRCPVQFLKVIMKEDEDDGEEVVVYVEGR